MFQMVACPRCGAQNSVRRTWCYACEAALSTQEASGTIRTTDGSVPAAEVKPLSRAERRQLIELEKQRLREALRRVA